MALFVLLLPFAILYIYWSLTYFRALVFIMASWTPFCKNRRSYEHAIHHGNDVSCPYCGMDNPDYDTYEEYSEPIITATSNEVITVEDSSPPSLQSTSTSRLSLDKASEIARQQSISRTKQMKPERPHAGSTALSSRPKNPPKGSQLISQIFPVNIYVYRGTLFDVELDLADKWTPIRQYPIS